MPPEPVRCRHDLAGSQPQLPLSAQGTPRRRRTPSPPGPTPARSPAQRVGSSEELNQLESLLNAALSGLPASSSDEEEQEDENIPNAVSFDTFFTGEQNDRDGSEQARTRKPECGLGSNQGALKHDSSCVHKGCGGIIRKLNGMRFLCKELLAHIDMCAKDVTDFVGTCQYNRSHQARSCPQVSPQAPDAPHVAAPASPPPILPESRPDPVEDWWCDRVVDFIAQAQGQPVKTEPPSQVPSSDGAAFVPDALQPSPELKSASQSPSPKPHQAPPAKISRPVPPQLQSISKSPQRPASCTRVSASASLSSAATASNNGVEASTKRIGSRLRGGSLCRLASASSVGASCRDNRCQAASRDDKENKEKLVAGDSVASRELPHRRRPVALPPRFGVIDRGGEGGQRTPLAPRRLPAPPAPTALPP